MKKQLLMLAAAATVATGAMAATLQQRTVANAQFRAPACELQLATPEAASQQKAPQRAFQDFGTCDFRTPVAHDIYPGYKDVYANLPIKRQEGSDGKVDYKVMGLFGLDEVTFSTEAVKVDVQMNDGSTKHVECEGVRLPVQFSGLSTQDYGKVQMADTYSWMKYSMENGNPFNATQADLNYYASQSYFDEIQGKFFINMVYFINKGNGTESFKYFGMGNESVKLNDTSWKTYEVDVNLPWFHFNNDGDPVLEVMVNLHDCQYANMYAIQYEPDLSTTPGQEELNGYINGLLDGSQELTTVESNGPAQIPLKKLQDGKKYTLFYIWVDADGNYVTDMMGYINSFGYATYEYMAPEPGWKSIGVGNFTDPFAMTALSGLTLQYESGESVNAIVAFELEDGYSTNVIVEENEEQAGVYRVSRAHSGLADHIALYWGGLQYDETADVMVVNASNPEQVYVEAGTTGCTVNTMDGPAEFTFTSDGADCVDNGVPVDPMMCGVMDENGVITFPEPTGDPLTFPAPLTVISGANTYVAGFNVDNSTYAFPFRLVVPGKTAISNTMVNNDQNAPVEYFNLQGMRVNNPQHGVYIMRQGNKVSKILK